MFHEVRENFSGKSYISNFSLQQLQIQALRHDKASQAVDNWDIGIARMLRMEEMHPMVEGYHNNQDPPAIVQPNKMQELTLSSTRCQTRVYPHQIHMLTNHRLMIVYYQDNIIKQQR